MVAQRRKSMKRPITAMIFLAMGFLIANAQNAAAQSGQISGYVQSSKGLGVPFVSVVATYLDGVCGSGGCPPAQMATTDSTGHYVITENFGSLLGVADDFKIVAEQIVNGQVVATGTPARQTICIGTPGLNGGYAPTCSWAGTANFTLNPVLKSGQICYESKCGTVVVTNVCSFCPNGINIANVGNASCPPKGLQMPIIEDMCK
jgi:hypothetical protein